MCRGIARTENSIDFTPANFDSAERVAHPRTSARKNKMQRGEPLPRTENAGAVRRAPQGLRHDFPPCRKGDRLRLSALLRSPPTGPPGSSPDRASRHLRALATPDPARHHSRAGNCDDSEKRTI